MIISWYVRNFWNVGPSVYAGELKLRSRYDERSLVWKGPPMNHLLSSMIGGALGWALTLQFPATAIAKGRETVVLSFNYPSGEFPYGDLIDVKGTLYGTTSLGGNSSGGGTAFSLDTRTGALTVLYDFCSQQNCSDGADPEASLIDVKGTLYGTTYLGGAYCPNGAPPGCGTVFSLNPTAGAEAVLHSFGGGTDGEYPVASLIDERGTLYGTSYAGGTGCYNGEFCGQGTVFSINPSTGVETVVYSFCSRQNCRDGAQPKAGLIDVDGTLYGTTIVGGTYGGGRGTVFAIDPKTGAEKVVHSFGSGTDGAFPMAGLIDAKGTLYGTTSGGGGSKANCHPDCGTVFSLNPKTGVETVVYSFCSQQNCADGNYPVAGLIDVAGTLYGTTGFGGSHCNKRYAGCGTVFSVDPAIGAETVLYSFCSQKKCVDGTFPFAGLIDVKRTLYGTTFAGGTNSGGTVFAVRR